MVFQDEKTVFTKHISYHLSLIFCFVFVMSLTLQNPAFAGELRRTELKLGSVGDDVEYLQGCLVETGYLTGKIDGYFGLATCGAVMKLQRETGLACDGIVGEKTWEALDTLNTPKDIVRVVVPGDTLWSIARELGTTVDALADANGIANPNSLPVGATLVVPGPRTAPGLRRPTTGVVTTHWKDVDRLFPKAAVATVIDVKSGARFQIKRLFGTNHADVEPLTTADTRIIKKFLGGKWSWDRRPIVVEIGGQRIAASMNGYPHGQSTIDNEFPGHFCVHFLGSRLHSGNRLDKDHQAAVQIAAGYDGI